MGNMVVEHYPNIRAFLDVLNSRKITGKAGDCSGNNDLDFFGFTMKDTLDKVYTGIDPIIQTMKKVKISGENLPVNPRPRKRRDYTGFSPNIPAAIAGEPKTMYRMVRTPQKVKTVNLVFNPCVNAGTSGETITKAGTSVFSLAYGLEKMGYRVKITVILFCARNPYKGDEKAVVTVGLKDYKDSFDIQKLSLPLAHVASFRRLGFDWIEKAPIKTEWGKSKGRTYTDKEEQKKVIIESGYNLNDAVFINVNDCESVNFDVNTLIDTVLKEREGK